MKYTKIDKERTLVVNVYALIGVALYNGYYAYYSLNAYCF